MSRSLRPTPRRTVPALTALALLVASAVSLPPTAADACGCLSPPAVTAGDFAVNQQAEQIIFEVNEEEGTITAHVLIQYAGAPERFAWLVPVPSVPDLDLTPTAAFGVLDSIYAPKVYIELENACPEPAYSCGQPWCANNGANNGNNGGNNGGVDNGGVEVIRRQTIGGYDTIIFSAEEAAGAVTWLHDEGFIVNDTMMPYMQPYLDAGMLFVAARLVPGAGVDAIKPLRMTYQAEKPMIPLQLTAVAAEPHLTVTTYILADSYYRPEGHPVAEIDLARLTGDAGFGVNNYPSVLARAIDDAGGDAFVTEFAGLVAESWLPNGGFCCDDAGDFCNIANDGQCQCPGYEVDTEDCAEDEELVEAITLLKGFEQRHARITRLTTRLSPEEMSFDPVFAPDPLARGVANWLPGTRYILSGCQDDVQDQERLAQIQQDTACADIYCGAGECVLTAAGAGCDCNATYVARRFTDLDGRDSVTCVPEIGTVDLAAGGLVLPDACEGVDCGAGTCRDVGGFPTCGCQDGAAATLDGSAGGLRCESVVRRTGSPGAENFSAALKDLQICIPPPTCDWIVEDPNANQDRPGAIVCEGSLVTDPARFIPRDEEICGPRNNGANNGAANNGTDETPAPRTKGDEDEEGCSTAPGTASMTLPLLLALLGLAWLTRRR